MWLSSYDLNVGALVLSEVGGSEKGKHRLYALHALE